MFNDSQTGKTSITKVCGAFLIFWGASIITYVVLFRTIDIITIVIGAGSGAFATGSALIAFKVFKPSKPIEQTDSETTTETNTNTTETTSTV